MAEKYLVQPDAAGKGSAGPRGPTLATWHLGVSTQPAKIVIAKDAAEVQEVVRNTADYPTPVIAVGALHSVTQCIVNDGGTAVSMAGLNRIIGFVGAFNSATQLVRVEAGVTLQDLHRWLLDRHRELSFSPEIGDATVGGLVTTMCKDSSINGPGHLSALVHAVTYVDHLGNIVKLSRDTDEMALEHYMCSYSTTGITLDATLVCRPAMLIRTKIWSLGSSSSLPKRMLQLKSKCDNIWAIATIDGTYLEQRWALPGRNIERTSPRWMLEIFRKTRLHSFLVAKIPAWVTMGTKLPHPTMVHHRSYFVNSYRPVSATELRLDFSYYEYTDLQRFPEVVNGALDFARAYKKRTGFAPAGFAMYFVHREGARTRLTAGAYSGSEGWSFVMDPLCPEPTNPYWLEFCREFTPWALSKGARTSLTQTKELRAGQYTLDRSYARPRFLTPYFAQFLADVPKAAGGAASHAA